MTACESVSATVNFIGFAISLCLSLTAMNFSKVFMIVLLYKLSAEVDVFCSSGHRLFNLFFIFLVFSEWQYAHICARIDFESYV